MADVSVRPARADDAPAIAEVQAQAWHQTFQGTVPPALLDQLRSAEAVDQWRAAAVTPPSPGHRLLVALAGDDVVGFAAVGPAADPDSRTGHDAELLAMGVLPGRSGEGHGSRLVNAAVEHLSTSGFTTVAVWLTDDDPLVAFLEGAGWAPDGARRTLDLHGDGTVVVGQQRLHTGIS